MPFFFLSAMPRSVAAVSSDSEFRLNFFIFRLKLSSSIPNMVDDVSILCWGMRHSFQGGGGQLLVLNRAHRWTVFRN